MMKSKKEVSHMANQYDDLERTNLMPYFQRWENVDDEIIGKLASVGTVNIEGFAVPKYTFITANGPTSCLGTVQIVEALTPVKMGTVVHIKLTALGKGKGNNRMKEFEIYSLAEMPEAAE